MPCDVGVGEGDERVEAGYVEVFDCGVGLRCEGDGVPPAVKVCPVGRLSRGCAPSLGGACRNVCADGDDRETVGSWPGVVTGYDERGAPVFGTHLLRLQLYRICDGGQPVRLLASSAKARNTFAT